jgi:hypothetical protein
VRGLDIDGEFVKFTGIGVLFGEKAVASLTPSGREKVYTHIFMGVFRSL